MTEVDELRPPVGHFAVAMENVLQSHDPAKGPYGWKQIPDEDLVTMIQKQLNEMSDEDQNNDVVAARAVDIGNIAMMIWDNACDRARKKMYGETPA